MKSVEEIRKEQTMLIDEMREVLAIAREMVEEAGDLAIHSVIRTPSRTYVEAHVPDDDLLTREAKQAAKRGIRKNIRRFTKKRKVHSIILFSLAWAALSDQMSLRRWIPGKSG